MRRGVDWLCCTVVADFSGYFLSWELYFGASRSNEGPGAGMASSKGSCSGSRRVRSKIFTITADNDNRWLRTAMRQVPQSPFISVRLFTSSSWPQQSQTDLARSVSCRVCWRAGIQYSTEEMLCACWDVLLRAAMLCNTPLMTAWAASHRESSVNDNGRAALAPHTGYAARRLVTSIARSRPNCLSH